MSINCHSKLSPLISRENRPQHLSASPATALLLAASLAPFLSLSSAAKPAANSRPTLTSANSALYIANMGDGSIMRCDGATGKVLATLGAHLIPVGLAIGPDHNLYVTSFSDGTVSRFSVSTGKSLGTFIPQGRGNLAMPVTMAFGPDRNLYVGNWKNNDIRRFDGRTGAFLGVFAKNGSGGLAKPGDIAFGPDGNLYVTNNSANDVLRFNGKTGASMGTFVKAGSGGLKDPQNIAFGADRKLYVGGPAGVLQFSGKTGAFIRVFAPHDNHLSDVGGMAFGPTGDLYVGDWQKNEVVRFARKTGAFQGIFVPPSSGLLSNRYILFGPRGGGGTSPVLAAAARAARLKKMREAEANRPALLAVGTTAPDFAAVTPDGQMVHLSDFKGKPVVLDFWATWCGPCQRSMPHLEKVYQQVKDKGVAVLGVCVWDDKSAYEKWVKENQGTYSFPTAYDPAGRAANGIAGSLYNVSGIPTQYLIDKDGKVVVANVGYGNDDHRLEAALTKLGFQVPDQEASVK